MIKILIADNHPVVRHGVRQVLSTHPECVVTDEAVDGREAVDKVRRQRFDVVILDITMPNNGLEALRRLTLENPDLAVLVLSAHAEEQYAIRVLEMGAAGYMTKDSAPTDLVAAVTKIARGGLYLSPHLGEVLAAWCGRHSSALETETLSDREFAVLAMIARGKTQRHIAGVLSVNPKTVGSYRARILEKLHLRTNADLVRYAIRNGLID